MAKGSVVGGDALEKGILETLAEYHANQVVSSVLGSVGQLLAGQPHPALQAAVLRGIHSGLMRVVGFVEADLLANFAERFTFEDGSDLETKLAEVRDASRKKGAEDREKVYAKIRKATETGGEGEELKAIGFKQPKNYGNN